MNTKNSKTPEPHRILLTFSDKVSFNDKYVALLNLSIYYTRKNIEKVMQNNRFKVLAPT